MAGIAVYYIARPHASVYFLNQFPFNTIKSLTSRNATGRVSGVLPDYLHCLGFILLTAGLLNRRHWTLWICLFWVGLECFMEVLQFNGERIVPIIPDAFSSIPYLENIRPFLIHGVFDPNDIMAYVFGGFSAYLFILWTDPVKKKRP